MKNLIALLISGALVVSGYSQTRNVLVGTNNAVVQPTNFWSADASNARAGLGLGSAATNPASAFQPSSTVLSNLSLGNGSGLTNVTASFISSSLAISNTTGLQAALDGKVATNGSAAGLNSFPTIVLQTNSTLSIFPAGLLRTNGSAIGLTNFPVIPVASGGTGGTNESTARAGIGLGTTNSLTIAGVTAQNLTIESGGGITLQAVLTNAASFRTNIGLPWSGLTSADAPAFRAALSLGTAATNPATAFQASSANLTNLAANNGGSLTNLSSTSIVGIIPSSNIATVNFSNLSGTLTIASGGTGATNAANARQNLGSTTIGDALFIATNAAAARTTIGATTVGSSVFTLANPSAITFLRLNADNTATALSDSGFRTAIGLGTAATSPATAFQPSSSVLTNLAANNGSSLTNIPLAGVVGALATNGSAAGLTNFPTVPLASNVTGTIAISNGGSGASTAGEARTNFGLGITNSVQFGSLFIGTAGASLTESGTGAGIGWTGTTNIITFSGSGVTLTTNNMAFNFGAGNTNGASITRTNLGLGWSALTNTDATNFRNAIGLGVTNVVRFESIQLYQDGETTNSITYGVDQLFFNQNGVEFFSLDGAAGGAIVFGKPILFLGTNASSNAAVSRTSLGLPWSGLTNINAATFQAALFGTNTNPVLVNTNGEVVSPTNFWQVAPITTTFIDSQPTTNQTTNIAAGRNLHIHSIAFSTVGITNTIALPTTNSFNGDVALVVHQGPTSSVTAVRTAGAGTNLITLNQFEQAVEFVYYNNVWQFNHNLSFIEPIFFSGTNAAANRAASRTNLGLGASDSPSFASVYLSGDITANSATIQASGIVFEDGGEALTRTNLGLGSTNIVTFAGLTNNGDITINQTATNNGLLYIRRTNNEAFLGLANLIASNNVTVSNETLFRVGVSEATNKAAQFGFRSTNTNGNGVAVFSVFGYNALMMIGPSDPAAGTNPIEATVYSVNPTNKVMTLIKTNTGATMFHRPIEFENTTNQAVTRTNLGIPLPALTNTSNTNFQAAVFTTNAAPTNTANVSGINFNTKVGWMDVTLNIGGTNKVFRIPLFQ
jgi:hypothetical protein